MQRKYYIISIAHTSKADTALTFWRTKSRGYTWQKDAAGVYSEDEAKEIHRANYAEMIEVDLVDLFWQQGDDHGEAFVSAPNTKYVRNYLKISDKFMKPKRSKTCQIIFKQNQ